MRLFWPQALLQRFLHIASSVDKIENLLDLNSDAASGGSVGDSKRDALCSPDIGDEGSGKLIERVASKSHSIRIKMLPHLD